MRTRLFRWVVGCSALAGTLSVCFLFRTFRPPDDSAALLAGFWVAMPFLVSGGLALLVRRYALPSIALLVSTLLAGGVGVSMLDSIATQTEISDREVRTAKQPGEDPNSGPGAMRKTGAEAGQTVGGIFSILLIVVLIPVQTAVVVVPTAIACLVSAFGRNAPENRPSAEPTIRGTPT